MAVARAMGSGQRAAGKQLSSRWRAAAPGSAESSWPPPAARPSVRSAEPGVTVGGGGGGEGHGDDAAAGQAAVEEAAGSSCSDLRPDPAD